MNIDKNKLEYVVGIDFGHGETSAAICPLQWDTPTEQLDAVKDLEMGGNKKVIPSAITILENGNAYIGDRAFRPDFLKKAIVKVCFKKAPQDINGKDEQFMIRFMKEVYQTIRANNPAILLDGNHLVYIATPSGWDKKAMDLYAEMAKTAGIPLGGITKESRAAFVRAQQDQTSGLGRNITKGAIVFDMGSSTLDFTYLNLSEGDTLIDHGYDCGASFIENFIFKQAEKRSQVIRSFEEKYPELTSRLIFEARLIKENVYFDPSAKVKKIVNFDELIDEDEDFEDKQFKIQFEPGELNAQLEKGDYIKSIEDSMRDYIDNYIQGAPIYGVFLTGGASRMDFIKPLITKIWGVPQEKIFRDQDPSLTISQGVAEVARMDLRTQSMDDNIGQLIEDIKTEKRVYNTFVNNFSSAMLHNVTEYIAKILVDFRDSSTNYSLNNLNAGLKRGINETVNKMVKQAPHYAQQALLQETQDVTQRIESMVAVYSKQGVEVKVPTLKIRINISLSSAAISGIINSISSEIASNMKNTTRMWLTGAGAVFGLLGMSIGYVFGTFFGDSEKDKMKKAMSKELNAEQRLSVYNDFADKEKRNKICNEIEESIDKAILKNQQIEYTLTTEVNKLLTDYSHELERARLLIK